MIDLVNEVQSGIGLDVRGYHVPVTGLTVEERKAILNRAFHGCPFFNVIQFSVREAFSANKSFWKAKIYNYIDFWLTEVRSNFSDVSAVTGADFELSLFTSSQEKSLYGYNRGQTLPTPFISTDTISGSLSFVAAPFDDRQREFVPRLVPHGEEIIAEIRSSIISTSLLDLYIVLAGINGQDYPYLTTDETQLINKSLSRPTNFQTFRNQIHDDPNSNDVRQFTNITNDNLPRLALGFGIVNRSIDAKQPLVSNISIEDTTRQLKFTSQPIPAQLLAPRVPTQKDTHIYYLPIEYYMMPFANLRFQFDNAFGNPSDPSDDAGYDLVLLTRTV